MQKSNFSQRYNRNYPAISHDEQKALGNSSVAIVGMGGLGGYMAEQLVRLGIGRLVLIDGDCHDETNLNRQLTATEQTIGSYKVLAAKERLEHINNLVCIEAHTVCLGGGNAQQLLANADLAMDALDSIAARLVLEHAAETLGIPLLFAAINGWYGMLGLCLPKDRLISELYGTAQDAGESAIGEVNEDTAKCATGNPAFAPAVVASLAIAEAVKLLVGRPLSLRHSWLQIDLLKMEFSTLSITQP
ncbi:MAG: HesA/MoeB/ThiF family protein [Coriobacteriia bacterium]|nr:HesA/MoeB/ThiF family protein [Coriobacteriia bacterium]